MVGWSQLCPGCDGGAGRPGAWPGRPGPAFPPSPEALGTRIATRNGSASNIRPPDLKNGGRLACIHCHGPSYTCRVWAAPTRGQRCRVFVVMEATGGYTRSQRGRRKGRLSWPSEAIVLGRSAPLGPWARTCLVRGWLPGVGKGVQLPADRKPRTDVLGQPPFLLGEIPCKEAVHSDSKRPLSPLLY